MQSPGAPVTVSQASATASATVVEPTEMRPLPGKADLVRVFNSNSPEVIQNEGILLSTLSPDNKKFPEAHLNLPLKGRFDIFFHHISNGLITGSKRTVYVGLLANNPSSRNVTLHILRAASYLSQPDAPFKKMLPVSDNKRGDVYAGPGDRVMSDFLHSRHNEIWPAKIVIPAHQSRMIAALPIPVVGLNPPINGRSGLIKLNSNRDIYLASVALFGLTDVDGVEHAPELAQWEAAVKNDDLARPREKNATAPGTNSSIVYGRVAGVAVGSKWTGTITDGPTSKWLSLKLGDRISYPISSIERGTFGTGQIQSFPLLVRYPDTAFASHGNYGVHYQLELPLLNTANMEAVVTLHLQSPLKSDERSNELVFYDQPEERVFFRGTVRVRYESDDEASEDKFIHLVQNRGQRYGSLAQILLKSHEHRNVRIDLFYPPDATPPQVLTIKCLPLE